MAICCGRKVGVAGGDDELSGSCLVPDLAFNRRAKFGAGIEQVERDEDASEVLTVKYDGVDFQRIGNAIEWTVQPTISSERCGVFGRNVGKTGRHPITGILLN